MTTRRGHVVSIVGNDMTIDSRVKRVAATAAAAGFKSTVIAYAASGVRSEGSMNEVDVIRVPVAFAAQRARGRVPQPLRPVIGTELTERHLGPRTKQLAEKRRLEALASGGDSMVRARLIVLKVRLRTRRDVFRLRRKMHLAWDKVKRKSQLTKVRSLNRLFRWLYDPVAQADDYEVAFGPEIERLKPDVIHAHDFHMIGVAVNAAARLKATGHETRVVYDAHELIEGLSYSPRVINGWLDYEKEFIGRVDAVLAVSPDQGEIIAQRYGLASTPVVVLNAPVSPQEGDASFKTIRDDVRVSGRLLVYHGKVDRERGVYTLVEALEFLPSDVHVVIMAQTESAVTSELEDIASDIGASDRLHIRPFVPAEHLPVYLSSADIAVSPFLKTGNTEVSLPNKLFEAIHAGLPILTSNTRALARFVAAYQIGEVFEAGSARDLATKAITILESPDSYRSRIGPELMEYTSWDHQATVLASVYSGLVGLAPPETVTVGLRDVMEDGTGRSQDGNPTRQDGNPTRLAIGPRNMAGQAFYFSQAVQTHLGVPSISFSVDKAAFDFPVHISVDPGDWDHPTWQASHGRMLASGFTHVLAESGSGVLGSLNGGFIDQQIDELERANITVGVVLHGSEIRDPRRHRNLPFSPYATDDPVVAQLERATARLRRHLKGLDVPLFVTTPDLMEDVPHATWLPVVVESEMWSSLAPPPDGERPVVLHLPSRGILKGSGYVDEVMYELEAEGLIEYLRPDNLSRTEDVPALMEQSDIVVDGTVLGAYGVMSVQAMIAGRLAVANVRDIKNQAESNPIIDADPSTLRAVMRDLISDRHNWKTISVAGKDFAARYHDGKFTAEVLKPFLGIN